MMKALKLSMVFLFIILFQVNALEEKSLTTEQWLEDLEFVVSKLKSNHPNPYYKINENKFDSMVSQARNEIKRSESNIESYMAIRKILAFIQDGHTQLLENGIFNLLDLRFPFRVDEFTDGVFITLIRKDYQEFLGSRLIAINGKPIEKILETITKVVNNDNKFSRKYWSLNGISFPRILYGLKVIDDTYKIELELITREGKSKKLILPSVQDDTNIEYGWSNRLNKGPTKGEYVSPPDILGNKTPLYFKNQGDKIKFYWFQHLIKERPLYSPKTSALLKG